MQKFGTLTHLPLALLALRLSVALVMGMWTADKFVNPAHAQAIFEGFYGISGIGTGFVTLLAFGQAALRASRRGL